MLGSALVLLLMVQKITTAANYATPRVIPHADVLLQREGKVKLIKVKIMPAAL
jgi:hypothetical protein